MTLTQCSRSVWDLNCQIQAKKCLCAPYLMNWLADFNQICMDIALGHDEELICFSDLDLLFKVTAGLKLPHLSQKGFVCTISHEPAGGFKPDLHGYNIWTW